MCWDQEGLLQKRNRNKLKIAGIFTMVKRGIKSLHFMLEQVNSPSYIKITIESRFIHKGLNALITKGSSKRYLKYLVG